MKGLFYKNSSMHKSIMQVSGAADKAGGRRGQGCCGSRKEREAIWNTRQSDILRIKDTVML